MEFEGIFMEKPIDHDKISGAVTVAGDAAKGAVKGVGVAAAGTAALIGGAFMAPVPVIGALAIAAVAVTAAYFIVPAILLSTPVLVVAGLGAAYGLTKGVSKVVEQKKAFDSQERERGQNQNIGATIQQAQQQAYMAGAQDGQAQVIQKLQEAQAAQEQQTNFAAKFADKKGAVTPEAIMKQREATAAVPPQLGA